MPCRFNRELRAYLDHELSLPRREALRQHLSTCRQCRQELEGLQQVERLLASLRPLQAPLDLTAATMRRVQEHPPTPVLAPRLQSLGGLAAAAALLLATLHFVTFNQRGMETAALRQVAPPELVAPVAFAPAALPAASVVSPRPARPAAVVRVSRPVQAARTTRVALSAKPAVKAVTAVAARPETDPGSRAREIYSAVRQHKGDDDPDLLVAKLENVAAAYPTTPEAAEALLTAAELQRRRGNLSEADAAYRRVLSLQSDRKVARALAHKALGELRTETVGEDEVARYHYQEAARVLQTASAASRPGRQTRVVMGDLARALGDRQQAVADYASAANEATSDQALVSLSEVL